MAEGLVEFLHKKYTYVFPLGAEVFLIGNKITVEAKNKKVKNLSDYLSNPLHINLRYNYKFALPITGMGAELIREYEAIADYFEKHSKISFLQFDHATSHELALCTFFKPMDFVKTGNLMNEINRSLQFLINIFRQPLIHLRQTQIIQPVDAVKRVNHNTIRHLTKHPENWKNVDYENDEIVPERLLTRVYEDDYSIYENVVFRDLIDNILTFLRKRIYYLTEILETFKESIQLDAVNRFNHQKYYLAIGKLYVGFYKMENSSEINSTLENLKHLYSQINSYKVRAVYTKNANKKLASGDIRRTNILTMHKDYKHVFSLSQKFRKSLTESKEIGTAVGQEISQLNYERFCAMLTIFAATNFNMNCPTETTIFDRGILDASFTNGDWQMNVKSEFCKLLGFNIISLSVEHKEAVRKLAIIPISYYIATDKKRIYESIVERLYRTQTIYDKYVFFDPFDSGDNLVYDYLIKHSFGNESAYYAVLPISITEINSFRRIQKLLFECLVLSNKNCDVCAFCGEPLIKEADGNFICKKCKTGIRHINCKHCNEEFIGTYVAIKNKSSGKKQVDEEHKMIPEFFRQEKQYLFRNIVNMRDNNYVCPNCGGENANKIS